MPHYIVTGRILGDDEDSMVILDCASTEEASRKFEVYMWENAEPKEPDEEQLDEVIINYVVACETQPRIVATPWGWENN